MNHLPYHKGEKHEYYNGLIRINEFNFANDHTINDAEIILKSRYPAEGFAVNDISTALITIDSGKGEIIIRGSAPKSLTKGDRILIKPDQPYYFSVTNQLSIRYTATPAWSPDQSRIIDDE